jgi:pyridoxamine 5'-phosphate oxidase
MAVQIGALQDAGYDRPIAMLRDCHRRIRHFVAILRQVAHHAKGYQPNEDQQAAVLAALRYFRTSGPLHTQDEEQSLFPRLLQRASTEVIATINQLELEHREAEELHRRIEELYQNWMSEFGLNSIEEEELISATDALEAFYLRHTEIEENVAFSAAETLLNGSEQGTIGEEFAARRSQRTE